MKTKGTSFGKDLNVRLDDAQAQKFQVLTDAMGVSRTETVRRILDLAFERHVEGLSESKIDATFRAVQSLCGDLTVIRAQTEAMRSVESLVRVETTALRSTVAEGTKESKFLLAKIYFDLRAIFEAHPKREALVELRDRLMREA